MDLFLQQSIEVLSGPAGLAAHLRATAGGPAACGVSLPLDVGAVTATIPPHLRRAVIARDRHCAFPGCHQPPAACQVHHLIPRSQGGTTSLGNMVLLCSFHHLIASHRWGWALALATDGTTTATSPDGQRTFHSHSPPTQTPAL
jgi:HNH endonuclease